MLLADKLALVTGGGRGIGRAVARAFAREGAALALCARTAAEVSAVAEELRRDCGVPTYAAACDVADADAVVRFFRAAADALGRTPDILVNNAGVAESAPLAQTDDELWRRHLETNLSGTFYFMRAALPDMVARGWGRVVNIASIAGKTGAPYIAAYAASKHGVLGLTRSVALEVATKGVTVNAVCPGYVDTDMTTRALAHIEAKTGRSAAEALEAIKRMSPQRRLVTPEEVAALALLLASDDGRGINGQAINVDGGTVLY
ncbi:MAG TPA: SDR family NAD(P)-dependent oxidoreductase [Pyrinomonadaceae bacterium]|jgi:NAD(P)-dependent dehydrogenase (short-subunit alcohol dehydrogenase family)